MTRASEDEWALAERLADRAVRAINDKPAHIEAPRAILFAPESLTHVPTEEPFAVWETNVVLDLLRVGKFSKAEIDGVSTFLRELPSPHIAIVIALRTGAVFLTSSKPGTLTVNQIGDA